MKTLYLDCGMGAAGDMLTAALLELHPDPADFLRRLNAALPEEVRVSAAPDTKCGLRGTHVTVLVEGDEEELAPEEREEFVQRVVDRLGNAFNVWFSTHPEEYKKI